jgi:hypothetical protein
MFMIKQQQCHSKYEALCNIWYSNASSCWRVSNNKDTEVSLRWDDKITEVIGLAVKFLQQ